MRFIRVFYKFILSRRYRVKIKGLELLKVKGAKLIIPNHQSLMDPQIIAIETYKYSEIVPVVRESFFKIPVVGYILKKFEAVPVSDFGHRNPNILTGIYSKVIDSLKRGKTVIIYPAGQLQDTGVEKIRNKQGVYVIASDLPEDVRVLGLRVRGLWGSMFSKAWDGERPVFLVVFLKGFLFLLVNLIFFCPKRDVTLEFVDLTDEVKEKSKEDRRTFNTFLEGFYNYDGLQPVSYIKHFFFAPKSKRDLPESIAQKV